MKHLVLSIGLPENEYEALRREWKEYHIGFRFVGTITEAVYWLSKEEYVCVSICADELDREQVQALRDANAPPIVLISLEKTAAQRAAYFHRGAADYIHYTNRMQAAKSSGKDALRYYLDIEDKSGEPITILTYGELYFCLEYRTVEVRGIPVNLTPKEFDLLALLIAHPKRVYTFNVISELVWNEPYYPPIHRTIISHISSLRTKLKVARDIPNYIVNVSKIGYKFEAKNETI